MPSSSSRRRYFFLIFFIIFFIAAARLHQNSNNNQSYFVVLNCLFENTTFNIRNIENIKMEHYIYRKHVKTENIIYIYIQAGKVII